MKFKFAQNQEKIVLLAAALFLVVDIGSKFIAHFLGWQTTCNYGIALGISIEQIWIIVLSIFSLVAICVIWYNYNLRKSYNLRKLWLDIAFVAVLVGALSNLTERILWSCVTDFIPFFGLWTMNISDGLISVAMAIIVWHIWRD